MNKDEQKQPPLRVSVKVFFFHWCEQMNSGGHPMCMQCWR